MSRIPKKLRNAMIVAFYALLAAGNLHADHVFGTPIWMSISADLLIFPTAAALTILLLSPGLHHLRTAPQRMAALGKMSATFITRKMFLRGCISGLAF